ncbi:hypothetical protein M1L59_08545 [Acinetobacter schindleri]|uniref:hypothetical protein n=1 Tax=Acinetobacter schindleri TaxID=108981 RepID=UPI00200A2011|nr:hypothetical protein [Acinetobacter schindleri]MCK8640746.1 hypothetical protein [Acinetobacter schindleri]WQJ00411.1 hypothetical protein Q7C11_05280 [Acinetobacter schindleri]
MDQFEDLNNKYDFADSVFPFSEAGPDLIPAKVGVSWFDCVANKDREQQRGKQSQ